MPLPAPRPQGRLSPRSAFIGTQEPGIFEATVVLSTGTLTQSLFVDCSTPASKEECKHGGWRRFGFKNQGQCIAFVNHGPQTRTAGLSE